MTELRTTTVSIVILALSASACSSSHESGAVMAALCGPARSARDAESLLRLDEARSAATLVEVKRRMGFYALPED